jgi:DNA-binding protein YbaB
MAEDPAYQALKNDVDQLRRDLDQLRASLNNLQVANESGGGYINMSGNVPILRITALTPSGVQFPGG